MFRVCSAGAAISGKEEPYILSLPREERQSAVHYHAIHRHPISVNRFDVVLGGGTKNTIARGARLNAAGGQAERVTKQQDERTENPLVIIATIIYLPPLLKQI